MAIILEGMDNSGKSTLAKKFGLEIVHPGPRPKTWGEEQNCLDNQLRECRNPIVMDRVTCISSQVYKGRLFDHAYMSYLDRMVFTKCCVIIYCRPPRNVILKLDSHEVKPYDTAEALANIKLNGHNYIESYDQLFKSTPHLVYNYITPDESVIERAMDMAFNLGAWKKWIS
jgi:hypothetical protein